MPTELLWRSNWMILDDAKPFFYCFKEYNIDYNNHIYSNKNCWKMKWVQFYEICVYILQLRQNDHFLFFQFWIYFEYITSRTNRIIKQEFVKTTDVTMVKVNVTLLKYMSREDFRVLTAVSFMSSLNPYITHFNYLKEIITIEENCKV